jgi:hypothetical protein
MARPLSFERHQNLIGQLAKDIRALTWSAGGPKSDLTRLAKFIGFDLADSPPQQRRRLKEALMELQAALANDASEGQPDRTSNALARWIDRFCVTLGPDLLATPERRQIWLDRSRDGARRARGKARDVRHVKIGLAEEQWAKIQQLGAVLGATTLSNSVAKIVDAFDKAGKAEPVKPAPDRAKATRQGPGRRPEQQTLLDLIEPPLEIPPKSGRPRGRAKQR